MRKIVTKEELENLLLQGYNNTEIASILGVVHQTVSKARIGYGLPGNFVYASKIDQDKLRKLSNLGLNDTEIAKELGNCTHNGVYYWRTKLGITAQPINKNKIEVTSEQHQVIIGGCLGDSYISPSEANSSLTFAHSIKQRDYFMWKYNMLYPILHHYTIKDITSERYKNPVIEIRTKSKRFPQLNSYRKLFYTSAGKKVLPKSVLEEIQPLGLAVWFMDDGYSCGNLSTNSFSINELIVAKQILKSRFNLDYTIHKENSLYLKVRSIDLFKHLVDPYVIPSMKYKLIRKSVLKKSQELLETPEVDNQQPSLGNE